MRYVIATVVTLALLIAAAWYGMHFVPVNYGYGLQAEFTNLPPDDKALTDWLIEQPGVHNAFASREPAEGRTRLVVIFGMTHDGWGRPPFPNLNTKCVELVYKGQDAPFRDQPPE